MSLCPRRSLGLSLMLALLVTAIACGGEDITAPRMGTLEITTSTSGTEPDPDGFSVQVDAQASQPIGTAETLTFNVAPGSHTVLLTDVALNCVVTGDNPSTAGVTAGETTTIRFTVTCGASTGGLSISPTTSGLPTDPDGYTITLDGADHGPVGVNTAVPIGALSPGDHEVGLSGVADNCSVLGNNPRTVTVTPGETTTVSFVVTCNTVMGSISVSSATSGTVSDPDGYTIYVDGADRGTLDVNGSVTLGGLVPGSHVIGLGGLAANCQIQGDNIRDVTVTPAADQGVAYSISCAPPPVGSGDLRITTFTADPAPDAPGYTLVVDGGAVQPIGLTAISTLSNLAPGAHSVQLGGVAGSCTLQEANPSPITIISGTTTELQFTIACATTTGIVRVTVTSSGVPPDPDGYVATLDDASPGKPILTEGNLSFTGVPVGAHTITLSEVSANCSVTGGPSQDVTVTAGASIEVSFVVTCVPTTGTGALQVTTHTSGSSQDDGYSVNVDGGTPVAIGPNATLSIEGLTVGTRTVALSGISSNCHVDGDNPRIVSVGPGSTPVGFDINCLGADALIAFFSTSFDLGAIFVVNPNGTGLRNLTPRGAFEYNPTWSPDGRKLLFANDGDLYVMDARGAGRVKLADGQYGIVQHRWSPDGRMIAYVDGRIDGPDIIEELWVMRADGGEKRRLADGATDPSWSPDAGRIAYVRGHIRIMNSDGSGDRQLTNRPSFQPAWSPDGSRIAFVTVDDKGMFLINPDGTGELKLTPGLTEDDSPTWSPDGSRIAFNTGPRGEPFESDVAVVNSDGTGRVNLTRRPGFDLSPAWSPDGSRLAYDRSDGDDSEIYVMNADGTGKTNLTNRPNSYESTPAWNGEGRQTVAVSASTVYGRWLATQRLTAPRKR